MRKKDIVIVTYCSRDSIKKAVKGTPFQYSTYDSYIDGDMVKFFSLYARYPCVEYLTKFGMSELVEAKLIGNDKILFPQVSISSGNPSSFNCTDRPRHDIFRPSTFIGVYGFTGSSSIPSVEFSHRSLECRQVSPSPLSARY